MQRRAAAFVRPGKAARGREQHRQKSRSPSEIQKYGIRLVEYHRDPQCPRHGKCGQQIRPDRDAVMNRFRDTRRRRCGRRHSLPPRFSALWHHQPAQCGRERRVLRPSECREVRQAPAVRHEYAAREVSGEPPHGRRGPPRLRFGEDVNQGADKQVALPMLKSVSRIDRHT